MRIWLKSLTKGTRFVPGMYDLVRFGVIFAFFLISCSQAAITRFEFVEEPNGGESLVTDGNDNPGPTILSSFTYTVESTPADIRIHNQFETAPVFSADGVIIADVDDGIETGVDIQLFEGLTWIYLFARNPPGNSGGIWELGPLSFEGGGDLVFRVDQGPPLPPTIGNFDIEGGRTANLPDPNQRAFFVNSAPSNNEVTLAVFFNKFDVDNSGPTMEITFDGSVFNDPAKFDADPDNPPNPNPVTPTSRPESNALVAAQLGRLLSGIPETGPPLLVEFVGDTTTFTGPGPLAVALIDRSAGQNTPNIVPARTGQTPGNFERIGFDFKTLPDGDYEIIVGAQDAVHADSGNGRSPGAFNAFGNLSTPVAGIPTRIIVRKDTVAPQAAVINSPQSVFIIGNTPPAVDPPFQDSIFSIQGVISNERQEPGKVHMFSQDSPDLDADPTGGPYNNRVVLSDPLTGQFVEQVNATNFEPPLTVPPYTPAAQSAYRFLFVPEDQQGNANTSNPAEFFFIKDYAPPPSPVFLNLADGDSILTSFFTVQAEADNDPTLVTAEHGQVNFQLELFRLTSSGVVGVQTFVIPASTGGQIPSTISVLDDAFVSASLTFPITDPNGVPTGQIATVNFPDQTGRFSGLVFEKFTMNRLVNLSTVPDGILRFRLCLLDQVGNVSNPCTSADVLKDLTGPVIGLNLPESGPDDNYTTNFPTIPNFEGADDSRFIISLKSPERTVDPIAVTTQDPSFPIASFPDPVDGLALRIRGSSDEAFGHTTRIEITGARIPTIQLFDDVTVPVQTNLSVDYQGQVFQVPEPSFPVASITQFEARIPLFNLLEGTPETLRLRAFDNLGNGGDFQDIVVLRDVNPPTGPQFQAPPPPSGGGIPVLFVNSSSFLLQGQAEPFSRLVLMTPPIGAQAGFDIPSTARIPRTTPGAIPIAGSQFDTLAQVCANLTCQFFDADETGLFRVEAADISTVATSLSTATTVWVQEIDAFDNTDPVLSARPIEVHKSDLEIPLDRLFILDYPPGTGERVQIFPDSTVSSPWLTVFYSQDLVQLEVYSFFPMKEAPNLFLSQPDFVKKAAGKLPSVFPAEIGTFSFRYAYEVEPRKKDYDGLADFEVSGGRDFFGNPVALTQGPALIVDTVAPSEFATPPLIVLAPDDSVRQLQFTSVRVDTEDWFRDQLVTTQVSGVATPSLRIELYGPLQGSTDSLNQVPMTTFLPAEPGFEIAASPTNPLTRDGTYRVEFVALDNLGNQARFRRSFVLDTQALAEPLILSNPADQSRVNTFPQLGIQGSSVEVKMEDIEADLNASDFTIFGPVAGELESVKSVQPGTQSIFRTFVATSHPATDGTSDGIYRLNISAVDLTGNTTTRVNTFIYDTLPPVVNLFWPPNQSCLSDLKEAKASVSDSVLTTPDVSRVDPYFTELSVSLIEPMSGSSFLDPGFEAQAWAKSLSQEPGGSTSLSALMEVADGLGGKGFPRDHSRDGIWSFAATFRDQASNRATGIVTFRIDSEFPSASVSGLEDGGWLTSQAISLAGIIQDRGCGFALNPDLSLRLDAVRLKVFRYDPDTLSRLELLATTEASTLSLLNPENYPAESMQAAYTLTSVLPVPATQPGVIPHLEMVFEISDRAGNVTTMTRLARQQTGGIALPRRLTPLRFMPYRGVELQTFTTSPVLHLQWEPVPQASRYRIHLSRQSLTPGLRTTFVEVQGGILKHSVDYSLISSALGGAPMPLKDTLYWFVEAVDQLGIPSDPLGILGRGEQIEYDREVLPVLNSQVFLMNQTQELDPASGVVFANENPVRFRWYPPEPVRLKSTELIEVSWPNGQKSVVSTEGLTVETDLLEFFVPIPAQTPNGLSFLVLEHFRDRAGNELGRLKIGFKLDQGPKLVAQVFQNPADPYEYRFVVKGLDWNGEDDLLRYDATVPMPRVTYTQASLNAGTLAPILPVNSIDFGNQVTAIRGFTSGFRLKPEYRGDIRLEIEAEDVRGHRVREEIFLNVAVPSGRFSVSQGQIPRRVEGLRRQSLFESPIESVRGLKILSMPDFPYVHEGEGSFPVLVSGSIPGDGSCTGLVMMDYYQEIPRIPAQKLDCNMGKISYQIQNQRLNSVLLVRDFGIPELNTPLWPSEVEMGRREFSFEAVDRETVLTWVALSVNGEPREASWSKGDEFISELQLKPGEYELAVLARDAVGNEGRLAHSLSVLRPFALDRFEIYPNPVRRTSWVELVFSRTPESAVLYLYDASGARMAHRDMSLASSKIRLDELLPSHAANGVYFLRLVARLGDVKIREVRKIAVLR